VHGSTFRHELGLARVRAAQTLLRESSASLTEIALEVGCATPQSFSTLFRRVVGTSPREWRARAQRDA
jgi:transcriptional regulator GlxA family with amidase domain